jgi:hypothetical protein
VQGDAGNEQGRQGSTLMHGLALHSVCHSRTRRVIQTHLASNGAVDTMSTSRRSLAICHAPPAEQWNDEHRTCFTTKDQVVPLPQEVETVASVLAV